MDHGFQQFSVHHIKALRIDIEHGQGLLGNIQGDFATAFDIGKIAHAAQQAVGNARRTAAAAGDFKTASLIYGHIQQTRAARDDALQFFRRIKLQPRNDAKAVAQGVGQHARPRGGAHQSEGLQVELDAARRRTFANHDVDLVIFQRGVEDFFHHGRQAVDFVDKQHITRFQIGQQRRQVFGLF